MKREKESSFCASASERRKKRFISFLVFFPEKREKIGGWQFLPGQI